MNSKMTFYAYATICDCRLTTHVTFEHTNSYKKILNNNIIDAKLFNMKMLHCELKKVSMGHGCPRLLFLFHLQLNIGYIISEQDTIYILQTEFIATLFL